MRRKWIVTIAAGFLATSISLAGALENELRGRMLGAWVVVKAESYSDCSSMYTNNRINGSLVKSRGRYTFPAGELAKVQKVDAKKKRLDVLLTLAEPRLLPYQEGPFTLYRVAECRVELEVVLDRFDVKSKNVDEIEDRLAEIVERYASADEARASDAWNERELEPFPADYDRTLAELEVWRANQTNDAVQSQLDLALEQTTRVTDRMEDDPDYLAAFVRGVKAARLADVGNCPQMLALDLGRAQYQRYGHTAHAGNTAEEAEHRGFEDGKHLSQGLELLRRLPGCFVPVPDLAEYAFAEN